MKQMTSTQIRQAFLDFFKSKGHMVEKGHSLIPHNDPTLLWINSGVAALKKYFDGTIKPEKPRITNAQKAIRSNDIENVGKTARHHTFFEMLGNFSIGDYFKKEAIHFAYEFLTSEDWMGLEKDRLYISIHTSDDEAYRIWHEEIGIEESHIGRFEQNYWEIGAGPSGPNSEIIYDRGEKYDPHKRGVELFFNDEENDRYIEVWNIVFSQFNAVEGVDRSQYQELPQKNIDTGMGFERLVCILQEGETNFDTDLFLPIIRHIEQFTDLKYVDHKIPYRVIADHIRSVTFALGDGALFSNEGRGYVLRRIIRRAIRFGKKLGIKDPFMYQLVATVVDIMKDFYPEYVEKQALIEKLVKLEEERFAITLADGERLLENLLQQASGSVISGEQAFKLYDTYGFPFELTQEIVQERGLKIDEAGYLEQMQARKRQSKAAAVEVDSFASQNQALMNFLEPSEFIGYNHTSCVGAVIGLFKDGQAVEQLVGNGEVILDKTVFYAESGGQVADSGSLSFNGQTYQVTNVVKAPHKQPLLFVENIGMPLSLGDQVSQQIDVKRRQLIMRNHSSVHLLHAALRKVLGTHLAQAGSYVSDEYSRFDFTHFEKVTKEQLAEIESLVNQWIVEGLDVDVKTMSLEEAKKTNAIALFDEKYGDMVRVVFMGEDVSVEFCGGTHVKNTVELGLYKIVSEESVGSGTRRITAITSQKAMDYYFEQKRLLDAVTASLNLNSSLKILDKINSLNESLAEKEKQIETLSLASLQAMVSELVAKKEVINHIQTLFFESHLEKKMALQLMDVLKQKLPNALIVGAFNFGEEGLIVIVASDAVVKQGLLAGALVKEAALLAGGKGGGRKDFAQAGIKDCSKINDCFALIREKVVKLL